MNQFDIRDWKKKMLLNEQQLREESADPHYTLRLKIVELVNKISARGSQWENKVENVLKRWNLVLHDVEDSFGGPDFDTSSIASLKQNQLDELFKQLKAIK